MGTIQFYRSEVMRKIFLVLTVLFLAGVVLPSSVFAQKKVIVKLASIAPENTDWGKALNKMSKQWYAATNGQVELVVYHNGVVGGGNEASILRLLKGNQIQAAVFTSIGMGIISPEVMTLSAPFLIRNDDELNLVLDQVKPELKARIEAKGFYPLAWAKSGWVKIFSKDPVFVPADLKKQKLGTSGDTKELNQAFKAMGYQLVPVDLNDVIMALNSGRVEAVYQSPLSAGAYQLFGLAKNMTSINIAPFMGGVIINKTAWRSIPDQYKPKILEICEQIEREIGGAITNLEDNATKTMKAHGLVVNNITPEQQKIWFDDVNRVMPSLLGKSFDRNLYQKIDSIVQNHRK
jgi:TRAP-type C4-dicarboxylate transport system substrate-binding protein